MISGKLSFTFLFLICSVSLIPINLFKPFMERIAKSGDDKVDEFKKGMDDFTSGDKD